MKKLALISSYCNTLHKQEVLNKNIDKFHSMGVDTLLFTPKNLLPDAILKKPTHCIITEENPIPELNLRSQLVFKYPISNHNIKHTLIFEDYGWASLNQIKRLMSYASDLDYDIIYSTLYDLNFDNKIEEVIKNNEVNYFFNNRRNDGRLANGGAIFSTLDTNMCKKISEKIILNDYLNFKSAERFLDSIREQLNIPLHSHITNDLIYELQSSTNFDISNTEKVKVFLDNTRFHEKAENSNKVDTEVALHFYDIKALTKVKIKDLEIDIDKENIIFTKIKHPNLTFTIDGKQVQVNYLDHLPKTEIKINDNNNWQYLKQYKV